MSVGGEEGEGFSEINNFRHVIVLQYKGRGFTRHMYTSHAPTTQIGFFSAK